MSIQEQFEAIGRQHRTGATVGDGMKATAKTAAWLGGITLLLQTLPLLIPILAGCLFFFRGCSVTPQLASRPSQPQRLPATHAPRRSPRPRPYRSPSIREVVQSVPAAADTAEAPQA